MTRLDLSDNMITPTGATWIAQILTLNTAISQLVSFMHYHLYFTFTLMALLFSSILTDTKLEEVLIDS